jgi:hypothetical protein
MLARKALAVRFTPLPATTVPVLANVPSQIGVGVDDGDALPSRTKDGGGDLPV